MNGVQTRLKCKPNVKRCKRFVFAAHSPLLHPNTLKTKAIIHFQTDHILTRFVFPPLRQRIFDKVPFKTVNYLNGQAENLEEECKRYSELLLRHPVDIVCLGIGENGHIAFNDPDVANFNDSHLVKVVELDPICRQQQVNEKCFEAFDLVPAKALTLTIPALLKADWMFCIVPFKNKANAVYNTLYGEISEKCPASILRKKENSCLYLDPESAERINL